METLGAVGLLLFVLHAGAHLANVAAVARASAKRAALACVLPPVGAFWAWQAGARSRVLFYGGTLALFTVLLVVVTYAR